jgi:hypothetical protein
MGNNMFDLIRNILNWMVTADGDVRGQAELVAPDRWERPRSGSRQSESWKRAGFDFEKYVATAVQGDMVRPITKFHGKQVELFFNNRSFLLPNRLGGEGKGMQAFRSTFVSRFAESFSRVVNDEEHYAHKTFMSVVQLMDALAIVSSQLNRAPANMDTLADAIERFANLRQFFLAEDTPLPCRYSERWYDHALVAHVLDQERSLQSLGLSLSMVSSRCVELQNAPIHAISRSLPGGGR